MIGSAGLSDPDEDAALAAEEALLADAVGHREAASKALGVYDEEGGLSDALAAMAGALDDRRPFDGTLTRVLAQQAELSDLVAELRRQADSIEEDPERLEVVRLRRVELRDLGRKYGDTLAEVMAFGQECQVRLDELGDRERRAAALEDDLAAACLVRDEAAAKVGAARRSAAPQLATAVQARLAALAMPKATLEITVGDDDPGDRVTFLLAANPGMAPAPIQRAASGGELSRVLLALRLVLSGGPDTMVFDEVDAGIGGATALEVGSALSEVAETSQVLVVTHLAQVAAHADQQVRIAKSADEDATTTTVESVGGEARVVELSRMLSGTPDSAAARSNAKDLLERVPRRAPDPSTAGPTR